MAHGGGGARPTPTKIAIAGASGFVGGALTARLADAGHDVLAMSRSGASVSRGARAVAVDVGDEDALANVLIGVEVAYYLVHSMASGPEFQALDWRLATSFGRAAADAGVGRIIYLGGLGDDPSSTHLVSRHEVGSALAEAGVPVVELRAAVVFGSGSISFEMLRYLTERLPFMVCPRWVRTRIQPIAIADLLTYLEQSMAVDPGVYEVGGADVTTYREMIAAYARARGLHRRRIVDIGWLTPRLSSYWVDAVTPVDRAVSHALVESLATEVVVIDAEPTRRAFTIEPVGLEAALRAALDEQAAVVSENLFDRSRGLADGVHTVAVDIALRPGEGDAVGRDLADIGGHLGWYGARVGWALRLVLGWVAGERLRLHRPRELAPGASVDWWRVESIDSHQLVLRGVGWLPGDAWLGYRISDGTMSQVASFRPRGIPGFLYWALLRPVHHVAFRSMARNRRHRARAVLGSAAPAG